MIPILGVLVRRVLVAVALGFLLIACEGKEAGPAQSPTPSATSSLAATPTPVSPPCPATPTPGPTATAGPSASPMLPPESPGAGQGIIVGHPAVFSEPTHTSSVLSTLSEGQVVAIKGTFPGEDWAYDAQTWPTAYQDWRNTWFQLADGGYVYRAFVYLPEPGEVQPWEVPEGERWVDVDTGTQTLTAYAGTQQLRAAGITSGKASTPTPPGSFRVWSRRESEVMASYDPADPYRVERVLFTQYFSGSMHALHLNYWQPSEVFGTTPTSHGCVGLWIDDAQWLWLFGFTGMRVEVHE